MKIKLLCFCLMSQITFIIPATKRHLQTIQKKLSQQRDVQKDALCNAAISAIPTIEFCPTKPPKKYHGSSEKIRLQKSIDKIIAEINTQKEALKTAGLKK